MSIFRPDGQPLTVDDFEALFELLAGLDGHPREPDDIGRWVSVARIARWTRAQVVAAMTTIAPTFAGFRIMPGHVTQQIAADRARIRQAWYCPDPPRALRDDPVAEIEWRRRAQASYADRALLALAVGTTLDEVPMVLDGEPEPHAALPPAEVARRIEQAAAAIGERKAIGPAYDTSEPQHPALDPDVLRSVREDLAQRQPAPMPRPGQERAS